MALREKFWSSALWVGVLGCSTPDGADGSGNTGVGGTSAGGAVASASANDATSAGGTTATAGPANASTSAGGTGAATTRSSGGSAGASGDTSDGNANTTTGSASVPPIDCRTDGDGRTTLVFVNRCADSITVRGSEIEDASVASGAFVCRDVGSAADELPSKRYWGFTGDDPGAEHHTLAEFTFNTDFYDFDWYNISHVDAFNLPMQIVPIERPDCTTLTCADDLLDGCPEVGRFAGEDGEIVACVSPDRDDGQSPVAVYFESCDDAYAWSGDDQNGDDPSPVRACAGEDWDIVFCPEGAE